MRCAFCGGLNVDRATFCASCGRDLAGQPARRSQVARPQEPSRPRILPPLQAPQTPVLESPAYPPLSRPDRSGREARNAPRLPASPVSPRVSLRPLNEAADQSASRTTATPSAPDAPTPFPPRTVGHLHALEQGALAYTQIGEDTAPGSKKIVRILFASCVGWQQVATLLRACGALQQERFSTLIIQGVYNQDADQKPGIYLFTNGQLIFDRGVRLGSQIVNRYQIETGTGFESEAVRIVLTE